MTLCHVSNEQVNPLAVKMHTSKSNGCISAVDWCQNTIRIRLAIFTIFDCDGKSSDNHII